MEVVEGQGPAILQNLEEEPLHPLVEQALLRKPASYLSKEYGIEQPDLQGRLVYRHAERTNHKDRESGRVSMTWGISSAISLWLGAVSCLESSSRSANRYYLPPWVTTLAFLFTNRKWTAQSLIFNKLHTSTALLPGLGHQSVAQSIF